MPSTRTRHQDMIIVRGANYYPQDIGRTAERSHPALRPHCNAAFIERRNGREMLVIVQEIERTYRHRINHPEIVGAIRATSLPYTMSSLSAPARFRRPREAPSSSGVRALDERRTRALGQ